MEQVIFGGFYDALSDTNTEYNSLLSGRKWSATESYHKKVVSTSGKIKNLRVKLNTAPAGAGKSYTYTLMLNGAPSALTLTIADTATSGADTTHEIDVVAGDAVSLRCEPTGTPTTTHARWTSMFEGATAKESLILGGTYSYPLSKTGNVYAQTMCASVNPAAVETVYYQVCPTSGKIKNLYVVLSEDPGTSPDAYRFTLRKNGASQTLTVTITADDTAGHDTDHEVTVAAGDILTLMIEPLETPSATPYANWGMTFVADTDGESVVLAGSSDSLHPMNTEYNYLQCDVGSTWFGTELNRNNLGQSCTLKKLYIQLSAAPGSGKSYTFTLRKPGNGQADGNLTVTITGAATTGNDVAHTDVIADDDYLDLKCTPANTPSSREAYWGLVGYITPPAPPPAGAPWNIAPRVAMMGA